MARCELILKLDGALWLSIISKPLLTPKGAVKDPKIQKKRKKTFDQCLIFMTLLGFGGFGNDRPFLGQEGLELIVSRRKP